MKWRSEPGPPSKGELGVSSSCLPLLRMAMRPRAQMPLYMGSLTLIVGTEDVFVADRKLTVRQEEAERGGMDEAGGELRDRITARTIRPVYHVCQINF